MKANTLTKRFANLNELREKGMSVDQLNIPIEKFMEVMGTTFIVVNLGGKNRPYILGPADMPHKEAKLAKQRAMEEAISRALKEDSRLGLRGMELKMKWASTALRIEQAFEDSIVYERIW